MHVSELKKHTNNVILSYDGDEAGQKAAIRVIKELDGSNMGIRVLSMEPYKDPDEFIKALGKEEYMERAKRSIDKTDFQLKCFAPKYDLSNKEQKHEFLTKTVELIMDKQERQQNKDQKIERGR
jgi:DNA primase